MKRSDAVTRVINAGKTLALEMPVTVVAVKQKASPVKMRHQLLDRDFIHLRLKLPNGSFIDCKIEGTMGQYELFDALTKDPHFKAIHDALNPPQDQPKERS